MRNCPSCGAMMIWLNGSVLHNPPTKFYQCRQCGIKVTVFADGTEEIESVDRKMVQ